MHYVKRQEAGSLCASELLSPVFHVTYRRGLSLQKRPSMLLEDVLTAQESRGAIHLSFILDICKSGRDSTNNVTFQWDCCGSQTLFFPVRKNILDIPQLLSKQA